MGETGLKAISIIALLVGVGTFGWLVLDQFFIPQTTTISSQQYYDFYAYDVNPSVSGAFANNQNIEINFTVKAGETVYFSYVANARIDDSSRPYSYITFYFEVDGIRWDEPYQQFRRWNENDPDGADIRYGSIALQHYNTTMAAGQHTVNIAIYFYDNLDDVSQQSLFVQVFK